MRCVLQRTQSASVQVNGKVTGKIDSGLLVLIGFSPDDGKEDYVYCCRKLLHMRIFNDEHGVMNKSVLEVDKEVLVVSQFTLLAATKKGNRPSYMRASPPDLAKEQYTEFHSFLETEFGKKVPTGIFGADMQVHILNDGPVTILIDSKNREI